MAIGKGGTMAKRATGWTVNRIEFGDGKERLGTIRQTERRRWIEDSVVSGPNQFSFEELRREFPAGASELASARWVACPAIAEPTTTLAIQKQNTIAKKNLSRYSMDVISSTPTLLYQA